MWICEESVLFKSFLTRKKILLFVTAQAIAILFARSVGLNSCISRVNLKIEFTNVIEI